MEILKELPGAIQDIVISMYEGIYELQDFVRVMSSYTSLNHPGRLISIRLLSKAERLGYVQFLTKSTQFGRVRFQFNQVSDIAFTSNELYDIFWNVKEHVYSFGATYGRLQPFKVVRHYERRDCYKYYFHRLNELELGVSCLGENLTYHESNGYVSMSSSRGFLFL